MGGLVEGGPTRSGHHTPAIIVEAPVNGTDAANVRFNAWQFRQILGRGVRGILLCQAESAGGGRAVFVSCRDSPHSPGGGPDPPPPHRRNDRAPPETAPCRARPPSPRRRAGNSDPTAW